MAKLGIQESLELLEAFDMLAVALAEAKKDGVLNMWDAPKFAKVLVPAKKAVDGAEHISLELQDLDQDEAQELVDKMFETLTKLAAAVTAKPGK